jgi:hypothetical protein
MAYPIAERKPGRHLLLASWKQIPSDDGGYRFKDHRNPEQERFLVKLQLAEP